MLLGNPFVHSSFHGKKCQKKTKFLPVCFRRVPARRCHATVAEGVTPRNNVVVVEGVAAGYDQGDEPDTVTKSNDGDDGKDKSICESKTEIIVPL